MSKNKKTSGEALTLDQRAKVFCQIFNTLLESNTVNRMGFLALGYVSNSDSIQEFSASERCESDSEHMISFVWAAWLMGALFKDELPGFKPGKVKYIGALHDGAEYLIGGDIPDDGNRNNEQKDERELKAMKLLVKDLPKKARKKAIKAFADFQKKDSYAYVIDKMLFPLVQLWRIKQGWPEGSMKTKEKLGILTGTDADFIEITGSDEPVIVTTAHTLSITKGKPGYDVACAIIKAQFAEAEKEIPDSLMNLF